ncbi:hypothetical protein VTJ49DRAFT_6748 [Mycothermus thermophilus]|uniref:Uncharacterized protein n=1 Tax=Humicola insolens TaxID=85995 RepID=A0ABR3VIU3_HUMIN
MNSAVKRKFNALIQGLGQQPATTTTTTTDGSTTDNTFLSSPHLRRSLSTSRLTTSTTTMPTDSTLDMLSKKRRVGGGGPGPGPGLTSTPSKTGTSALASSPASIRSVPAATTGTTASISNITLRRWTPGTTAAANLVNNTDGRPPPPKYCPNDREQLLRRLSTFQELTDWAPKPERVSEIEWAKRGWTCVGKERVRCSLCARELTIKVNRREEPDGREVAVLIASEIAESVIGRYRELVVEGHGEECLWRRKGCDDSLLRLPYPNPKLALQGLRQRYDELCERGPFLPYESSIRLPSTLNLDTVISHLPPDFFTHPPPPATQNKTTSSTDSSNNNNISASASSTPSINRSALALALLGWQSLTHPQLGTPVPNSASCHTCLRRLGLWMFRPRDPAADAQNNSSSSSPSSASSRPLMDHLDPLREHRFFCPWKNPAAQRNPAARPLGGAAGEQRDMAAWEVLVVGLRNEAFIREKVSGGGGGKKKAAGVAAGHGRSKSSVPAPSSTGQAGEETTVAPSTPVRRPTTAGAAGGVGDELLHDEESSVDDEEARKKKEMDVMSKLRRVKSLFNTKAGGKLRKLGASSRPGTSHSSVAGGE